MNPCLTQPAFTERRGKAPRNQALDALRGIAALGVVLFHYGGRDAPYSFVFGKYGVELFFLISGYVILMSAETKPSALVFLQARILRLYPTFWLSMAFTLGVAFATGSLGNQNLWIQIPVNMTMFPKFFGVEYIDGVYWTLELELIFYALVFVLIRVHWLTFCPWALAIASSITSIASILDLRGYAVEHLPHLAPIIFRIFFLLLDGYAHLFLLGVLAYLAKNQRFRCQHWILVAVACVGIICDDRASAPIMAVICTIFVAAVWPGSKWTTHPILLWLGAISYPLYLIHMQAGRDLLELLRTNHVPWGISFVVVVTLILASAEAIRRLANAAPHVLSKALLPIRPTPQP